LFLTNPSAELGIINLSVCIIPCSIGIDVQWMKMPEPIDIGSCLFCFWQILKQSLGLLNLSVCIIPCSIGIDVQWMKMPEPIDIGSCLFCFWQILKQSLGL